MLQLFEKLINEHGSSTILKERLTILKDEYTEIEKSRSDLQAMNGVLQTELDKERHRANKLEAELSALKAGAFAKYVCDHCGSASIKRIGNRPDPMFGDLGVKEYIFRCEECQKESAFQEDRA